MNNKISNPGIIIDDPAPDISILYNKKNKLKIDPWLDLLLLEKIAKQELAVELKKVNEIRKDYIKNRLDNIKGDKKYLNSTKGKNEFKELNSELSRISSKKKTTQITNSPGNPQN